MREGVVTLRKDLTCSEAGKLLVAHGISGAPVVDHQGLPVGALSQRDLLSRFLGLSPARPPKSLADLQRVPLEPSREATGDPEISEVMTSFLVRVDVATPLTEVIDLMVASGIHRVFVTREEKICGIVSGVDLARILGQVLEAQQATLPSHRLNEHLM